MGIQRVGSAPYYYGCPALLLLVHLVTTKMFTIKIIDHVTRQQNQLDLPYF
jgi:hypothetical protein